MNPRTRIGLPGLALTALAALLLGAIGRLPSELGLLVAAGGVGGTVILRTLAPAGARPYAIGPALAALAVVTFAAPVSSGAELLAGLGGVALLVWMVDDPDRPVGGLTRGAPAVAVPALAVGIAWAGSALLPAGALPLGLAGGVLALVLVVLAFVLGRPDLFDREAASS
jgi:hypothetical protein